MNQPKLDACNLGRLDELLASPPPMAPAPVGLHARVMAQIRDGRAIRRGFRLARVGIYTGLAAALALGAIIGLQTPPAPAPAPAGVSAAAPAVPFPLDPTPALGPVTRFVAGSLDAPVRGQINSLLDDTRRARDLVVSCLPFSARGG